MIKGLKLFIVVSIATVIGSAPSFAVAKKAKKKAAPPSQVESEVSLPVPASELELNSRLLEHPPVKPGAIEIGFSTWAPREFSRPTYLNGSLHGSPEFAAGAFPLVSVSYLAPLLINVNQAGLVAKLGLATKTLERTVSVPRVGGAYSATQSLSLFSVRLGLQAQGPRMLSDRLQPFAGFALLPTLALSSRSQVEGSVSAQGLPFEASAGVAAFPSFLSGEFLGLKNGSIGLAVHSIFGFVEESKMDDVGAEGFFRIEL